MNSIKILVSSLEEYYPSKTNYILDDEKDDEKEEKENLGSEDIESIPEENGLKADYEVCVVEGDGKTMADDVDVDYADKLDETVVKTTGSLGRSIGSIVFDVVFFLPYWLILRPLAWIWFIVTYPFVYLFARVVLYEALKPNAAMNTKEMDINEKTALLKRENIIANAVKSPTSSSKYIMPPPQRLYPLSRNPGKRKRKTLILDLDETLIHSLSRGSPRSLNRSSGSSHTIEVKINNTSSLYHVHKRPYCDFFLKEIAKWFELQIFTASVKEYADPIIDWLENDTMSNYISNLSHPENQQPKLFTRRYYRNDCTYREGVGYIKNLSNFFTREEELRNVVILDNSPISYALHEENAVMIEGWINDQSDRDLLNLLPMLHSLSLCIDVRLILGLRKGERIFER